MDEYDNGGTIYIHCNGGHGRAGTVASVIVGKMLSMDVCEAVSHIELCRNSRLDTSLYPHQRQTNK